MPVPLKSPGEIDAIGSTGRLLWAALDRIVSSVRAGITSRALQAIARECLADARLEPVLDGYCAGSSPPFPGAACICVNEEAVHAVPSDRIFREGDLVTIDLAGRGGGWCADAARSVVVGADSGGRGAVHTATLRVLEAAVARIAPGVRWAEIAGHASRIAGECGVRLIAGYDGHGIGIDLHEPPRAALASSSRSPASDFVLRPGMVITIEPVVTAGAGSVVTLDDGWTVLTTDRATACHEERTVAVVRGGCRLLTGPAPA